MGSNQGARCLHPGCNPRPHLGRGNAESGSYSATSPDWRSASPDQGNVLGSGRRSARASCGYPCGEVPITRGGGDCHDPWTEMVHLTDGIGNGSAGVTRGGGDHDTSSRPDQACGGRYRSTESCRQRSRSSSPSHRRAVARCSCRPEYRRRGMVWANFIGAKIRARCHT